MYAQTRFTTHLVSKNCWDMATDEFENVFASFETNLHPVDREPTLAKVRRHLDDR